MAFLVFVAALCATSTEAGVLGVFEDSGFSAPLTADCGVPRFSVYGGELYAPSANGIYKYTPDASEPWTLWAMEGCNVLDFVYDGSRIMAVVVPETKGFLDYVVARVVRADLGGSEPEDITADEMQYEYNGQKLTYLMRMAQHPADLSTVMVATHSGVFISYDFGDTWSRSLDVSFGYNPNQFLGWHPYASDIMFYTSENSYFTATIMRSGDGGKNWQRFDDLYPGDNSCHQLAFDPNDAAHILISGEGVIWESTDYGLNWRIVYEQPSVGGEALLGYAYNVMFNPAIQGECFSVGCVSVNERIVVFKSADNGLSWKCVAESELFSNQEYWVSDAVIFEGKLFIYTRGGILTYTVGNYGAVEPRYAEAGCRSEIFDLNGRRLTSEPSKGIYVRKTGIRVEKVIKQ